MTGETADRTRSTVSWGERVCSQLLRLSRSQPKAVAATLMLGAGTAALLALTGIASVISEAGAHRAYCLSVSVRHLVGRSQEYPVHCLVGELTIDLEAARRTIDSGNSPPATIKD